MKMEDHDDHDGRKVWLRPEEVDALLDEADGTTQTVALGLLARCGLRVAEAADVTPADVVETPIGPFVRVQEGKGSKYRETPVPADLAASMRALADVRDDAADTPLVDRSTRTIRRWVKTVGKRLYADTGDDGWTYLGPHDLRRTWGTLLVERESSPDSSWSGAAGRTGTRSVSSTSARTASTLNSAGWRKSTGSDYSHSPPAF